MGQQQRKQLQMEIVAPHGTWCSIKPLVVFPQIRLRHSSEVNQSKNFSTMRVSIFPKAKPSSSKSRINGTKSSRPLFANSSRNDEDSRVDQGASVKKKKDIF